MADTNDMNANVIKEFRANAGVVGGFFEGKPVLLLHHTGAKSGTVRVSPLMYNVDGDKLVRFTPPFIPNWTVGKSCAEPILMTAINIVSVSIIFFIISRVV